MTSPEEPSTMPRVVLAVDVGGSHVKVLTSSQREPRRAPSDTELTPAKMVAAALASAEGWEWAVVSVGVPAPVHGGRVVAEPANLGKGWRRAALIGAGLTLLGFLGCGWPARPAARRERALVTPSLRAQYGRHQPASSDINLRAQYGRHQRVQ